MRDWYMPSPVGKVTSTSVKLLCRWSPTKTHVFVTQQETAHECLYCGTVQSAVKGVTQ